MLTLNVWKNQKEIEKTFEAKEYDLMYGTVEDVLAILDGAENADENQMLDLLSKNRKKLNDLILDIFPEMTAKDLRGVKVKELIPLFVSLFSYVQNSFAVKN